LIRQYSPLTGADVATAIAKKATALALSIPGLNSRLVTFPRVKVTITVRVEAFDRGPAEITSMDDLIDKLVAEGTEEAFPAESAEFEAIIDETAESPDKIRLGAGIAITRPKLIEGTNQIVDEAVPLPAGENLDNIVQFGMLGAELADGTTYSGRGRVIENETVGLSGASPVGPKFKGPEQRHFRIREPQKA